MGPAAVRLNSGFTRVRRKRTGGRRMSYETLVDARTLYANLHDSGWVVVDCRFDLADTAAGGRRYREGHIPGAIYAHLDENLSGPVTAQTGRHPLPEIAQFVRTLGLWGIDETKQVVAYDDVGGSIAARLWWLLRWLGHHARAVLDGGVQAWRKHGYPLVAETCTPSAVIFPETGGDPRAWVDTDSVMANLSAHSNLLLDARAEERYRGELEPIDPVAGHVPGAINVPMTGNLNGEACFLEPETLRKRFLDILEERSARRVVHMCGSGVTACHNLLAMEIAGLSGSRLYPGSWSEWIRDSSHPVARGAD